MYTDPIADMLNRIRTAQAVNKKEVDVPFSILKYSIAQCMEKECFIDKVTKKKKEKHNFFSIKLKYNSNNTPVITELKRVSSPGQRVYSKNKELKVVKGGRGVAILSTPKGIMTNYQARKQGTGGEIVCEIW